MKIKLDDFEENLLIVVDFVDRKQNPRPKGENYVLFGGLPEDLSLGYSLSDSSEGLLRRGKGGARIYRSFCKNNKKTKPGS